MKQYRITLNGRTFDVQLLSDPRRDQVQVNVNGETFTVEVRAMPSGERADTMPPLSPTAPAAAAPAPPVQAGTPSSRTVTAPLPGIIKSIGVRPDQQVDRGDELFVIEAMKMDNIIRASRKGVIDTIHVTEGHRVAHSEPVLEYRE